MTDANQWSDAPRILVFIPMYNCAAQISRVLHRLSDPHLTKHFAGVLCVDNRSTDGTLQVAGAALQAVAVERRVLLQNQENYGLGGSHKVAIEYARQHDYNYLLVLHGDDQGSVDELLPLLDNGCHLERDCLLGARFIRGASLQGYSLLRTSANHLFNVLFSLATRHRLYDLGSGINLYRTSIFADGFAFCYPDDLTFNYYLIVGICRKRLRYTFFPIVWREDDQVSNAKLFRQGLRMLSMLGHLAARPSAFMAEEHRNIARMNYPARTVSALGIGSSGSPT